MTRNMAAVILFAASFLVTDKIGAEDGAPNCPKAAPPIEKIIKRAQSEGLHLIAHETPVDGELIQNEALPADEWFALQRAHMSRRISLGLPSRRNDLYLYEDPDGKLIVIFAACGCYIGTMTREGSWNS